MKKDKVIELKRPETIVEGPLTSLLQDGARKLLAEALEAEIENFLSEYEYLRRKDGRRGITKNGHLPEREIQSGIGPIPVEVPRSRDREAEGEAIKFESSIVPKYERKTRSMEALIPWLYLKGISTGAPTR